MANPEEPTTSYLPLKVAATIIPTFNGSNITVKSFISKVENAKQLTNPRDLLLFIALVRSKVEGRAERALPKGNFTSLQQILDDLRRAYEPKQRLSDVQSAIAHVYQARSESALEYGTRVEELVETAREIIEAKESTEHAAILMKNITENALRSFIKGLSDDLEQRVLNEKPNTLRAAVDKAVGAEKVVSERRKLRNQNPTDLNNSRSNKPNSDNDGKDSKRTPPHDPSLTCKFCKRIGHTIDFCRSREFTDNLLCTYCKRRGHVVEKCRTRAYEERKNSQGPSPYQPNTPNNNQQSQTHNRPQYNNPGHRPNQPNYRNQTDQPSYARINYTNTDYTNNDFQVNHGEFPNSTPNSQHLNE